AAAGIRRPPPPAPAPVRTPRRSARRARAAPPRTAPRCRNRRWQCDASWALFHPHHVLLRHHKRLASPPGANRPASFGRHALSAGDRFSLGQGIHALTRAQNIHVLLGAIPARQDAAHRCFWCAASFSLRSESHEWPMVVPGWGLRKAAHGCAAAASQPWMADRAEEQSPPRNDPYRRHETGLMQHGQTPRSWRRTRKKPRLGGASRISLPTFQAAGCTPVACAPFGPWVTSYWTRRPSWRLRKPFESIAE